MQSFVMWAQKSKKFENFRAFVKKLDPSLGSVCVKIWHGSLQRAEFHYQSVYSALSPKKSTIHYFFKEFQLSPSFTSNKKYSTNISKFFCCCSKSFEKYFGKNSHKVFFERKKNNCLYTKKRPIIVFKFNIEMSYLRHPKKLLVSLNTQKKMTKM